MIEIEVKGVGAYRDIFKTPKFMLPIPDTKGNQPTVFSALEELKRIYGADFEKEVYLEDGAINDWARILLNGRDIRFLAEEKLLINDGDSLIIMSILAGG